MADFQTLPKTHFSDLPGSIPSGAVPEDTILHNVAQIAVQKLNDLKPQDLAESTLWRDFLALTGSLRTLYSADKVYEALSSLLQTKQASAFALAPGDPHVIPCGPDSWVEVGVTFTCKNGSLEERCAGIVSLTYEPGNGGKWKIWMLRTWLENFAGHGHPDVLEPTARSDVNYETREDEYSHLRVYDCVIVGGGQNGLSLAGRLQALGVDYLLLEKNARIGDVWGNRYSSLRWHTTKEHGNLPFGRTYPDDEEELIPTKRIAMHHNAWAKKYGLNVKSLAYVEAATWDEETQQWTITVGTVNQQLFIKAKNLVLCVGPSASTPVYPSWAELEKVKASGFKGTIVHSFEGYQGAGEWKGKHAVVIGAANTGHDIAEELADAGADTTIVQRGSTIVFPGQWLVHALKMHYRADRDTAMADRATFTAPLKIQRDMMNSAVWGLITAHPERFDALERAGFKLDRFGDVNENLYNRFGGHYVDIGCSARIASGEIKIKASNINGLTSDGLLFDDGFVVPADLIVLCTGFNHVFRKDAARVLGPELAEKMGECLGLNEEGEIGTNAKPTPSHPHLYCQGGDIRMARWYSRFTALQIQADLLGQRMQQY